MQAAILPAIRRHPQLKGSLRFTAIELAHLATKRGYARVPYRLLAHKTGLHLRTMQRHIDTLVALGIIRKYTKRLTRTRCDINVYYFVLPIARPLHKRALDKVPTCMPQREKDPDIGEQIRRQEWAVANLPMTAEHRQACLDTITRLRGLLPPP